MLMKPPQQFEVKEISVESMEQSRSPFSFSLLCIVIGPEYLCYALNQSDTNPWLVMTFLYNIHNATVQAVCVFLFWADNGFMWYFSLFCMAKEIDCYKLWVDVWCFIYNYYYHARRADWGEHNCRSFVTVLTPSAFLNELLFLFISHW